MVRAVVLAMVTGKAKAMSDVSLLDVELHGRQVGTLTRLADDRVLFSFSNGYVEHVNRPTLSLSFKDQYGGLITQTQPSKTKVPTFFSNLLPEGHLREYLALRAGVNRDREFFLLWVLGNDLPGAVKIVPVDGAALPETMVKSGHTAALAARALRFSLAGVQLKFSAIRSAVGGLTIPADGMGGAWIVKLPSERHLHVPENEFAMMELARRVGIDVPETQLVPIDQIDGLPDDVRQLGAHAFIIKRFDRADGDRRIHIEDFAQVFGVYPDRKYERANHEMIARVLVAETDEAHVVEFVRRFVFNALIGNGDMHLKNWSLIYPNAQRAALAPAYDFVSTIAYMPNERLALNFAGTKDFADLTLARIDQFADRIRMPSKLIREIARQTVHRFLDAWSNNTDLPIWTELQMAIDAHLSKLPISKL